MVLFNKFIKIPNTDSEVNGVSSAGKPISNTLMFIQKKYESLLENLENVDGCCVVTENNIQIPNNLHEKHYFIIIENPRLEFAKIYGYLGEQYEMDNSSRAYTNNNGSIFGGNIVLGKNVLIEPFCFIDHDVTIGENTVIRSGTRIRSRTSIGENCIIKENSVIGTPGFSFELDENEKLIRVPQLGGVIINNDVQVGALCTVDSGAIEPTIIHNQVKMMDHAHVAHNVEIGMRTIIGAGTTIAGSTKVGKNVWISPNSAITNQIRIEDGAVVGLSARVHKSITGGSAVINEGADLMENVLQYAKMKKKKFETPTTKIQKYGRGHPYFNNNKDVNHES